MRFEFNSKICSNTVNEMHTIEYRIRHELETLTKVYNYYHVSEDNADREIAKKIYKQMTNLQNEILRINILKQSLSKITRIYEDNEKQISSLAENNKSRFNEALYPVPIRPLNIIEFKIPKELKVLLR